MKAALLVGFIVGALGAPVGLFIGLQGDAFWANIILMPVLLFSSVIVGEPLGDLMESNLLIGFMVIFSGISWAIIFALFVSILGKIFSRRE